VEANVAERLHQAQLVHLPAHAFDLTIDGQALHFGWRLIETGEQTPAHPGTRHAVVMLAHQLRPVTVRIHTVLDGGPVLERWLEITNTGELPAALAAVTSWGGILMRVRGGGPFGPVPGRDGRLFSIGRFVDPLWGNEGDFAWETLPWGTFRLESRRGRSGRPAPFFVVRDEVTGELAIGHLAWSGNWAVECLCEQDQTTGAAWMAWRAGPQAPAPLRILAPGETVATPAVHLGYLHGDLDDAVQAMHAHVRSSIFLPQPDGRADRVVYNHWSYARHELSEPVLLHEIEVAHAVGAEIFIVDTGWFGHRGSDWATTVGDWQVGDRLPHGLEPVFAYARERGLLCGLWMDAKRLGSESRMAREHPDWLLQRDGGPVGSALDLTNPAVVVWLEDEINRLVDRYDLDLFRLDYNIDVGEGGYRAHAGYY
jgi:alpha-galactosidase